MLCSCLLVCSLYRIPECRWCLAQACRIHGSCVRLRSVHIHAMEEPLKSLFGSAPPTNGISVVILINAFTSTEMNCNKRVGGNKPMDGLGISATHTEWKECRWKSIYRALVGVVEALLCCGPACLSGNFVRECSVIEPLKYLAIVQEHFAGGFQYTENVQSRGVSVGPWSKTY